MSLWVAVSLQKEEYTQSVENEYNTGLKTDE